MAAEQEREDINRLAETLRHRQLDLKSVEAFRLGRWLESYVEKEAETRMLGGKPCPKVGQGRSGKTEDGVGKAVGMSGECWRQLCAVMDAAEANPEHFGDLAEKLRRGGTIKGAWVEYQRRLDRERAAGLAPVEGRYRALVVDPPWESGFGTPERGVLYAQMDEEEILALPVPEWADERCHLWLWTTNFHMPLALRCVEAWGFEHKSVLTWHKPKMGQGWYLRNNTEHCLLGVRGRLSLAAADIPSCFTAAVREHSEKPEEFYTIVQRASPAPIGEAFQRTAREGFQDLYAPEAA
jgi:N6-adenosine-specific RNA methylase IME4